MVAASSDQNESGVGGDRRGCPAVASCQHPQVPSPADSQPGLAENRPLGDGVVTGYGTIATTGGQTRTASCSWSRSARAGTISGGRVDGAGRLACTAANWRPVSGFSPAHTSLLSRSLL